MLTLLSSLLGFLSAAIPELFKLVQDKRTRQHELDVMDRQTRLQQFQIEQRAEEVRTEADKAAASTLYQTYYSGIDWVDALNGTVRPVLAYGFFFLYCSVKIAQFSMISQGPAWMDITLLWGEEDQAIFASIISFYYGQRAMAKALR